MFQRLRARKWWKKFFERASRQERRKMMRTARKMQRRKHKVWRGVDIEAGGLLLGKYYTRHKRIMYDREELVFVNLRNANMGSILNFKVEIVNLKKRIVGFLRGVFPWWRVRTRDGADNTVDLRDYMTLEYKLPGKFYQLVKLLVWHWGDLSKGLTVIGSWHSHPVGIQEPSEQDEKTAVAHKERLGLEVYFLGIEKNGNVQFWKY